VAAIREAGERDAPALAELARVIWTEHYEPIIGLPQVEYMLERFQTARRISDDMRSGYRYFMAEEDGRPIEYMAAVERDGLMFLSKIYVLRERRGNGTARAFLDALLDWCRQSGLSVVQLTVNRRNHGSIAAYERLGFRTVREQVVDIGGGYVMDDRVMELRVPSR